MLAGKLFDRLPLNHSPRTPALLSSVLPPPMSGPIALWFFVSFFPYLSLCLSFLLDFRTSSGLSSFHSPSVNTPDRCVIRLGKIAKNGRAHSRRARRGCCCKLGFYYGNSHTYSRDSGFKSTARHFEDINNASLLTRGAYYGTSRNIL